ncbi:aminomethyl-transferring glycine dehydrogenase subunit GcvPA [candidate division KSB3 bacterium]|uniref:Probable glycine dehydrogenase (decarboxylating) subunit 1 n=1 Tax=candidate division KSB3 bacterium TaxID=2044937 RepID=A0A9D5Q4I3_9BACT|nr:aminomethyl-transferring glycine dehydrogenase subunit GcvPA [candidate division KSB3 bacterium]MBD3323217.1 aminomethyl-transferring glycine dehydrogenase subunit GcvPA [candidate division KSB3 bacterium]
MRYIPNTTKECQEMLQTIGVTSIDDLFVDVPASIRLQHDLDLPAPHSEMEIIKALRALSDMNASVDDYVSFLGGGAYNHFIPAVVGHMITRGEFATAYTPYQPEISQGTLQAIFEFQSLICQLTDMDVANASMYDGASALAEAVIMAQRFNKRSDVLVAKTVHPEYRQVVNTYTRQLGMNIHEIGISPQGKTDIDDLRSRISDQTSSIVVQYPNFLGIIEELAVLAELAHDHKALLIVTIPEPMSLGLLAPPGKFGADIVVGEAQSFGNHLNYGGPYVGFFAIKGDAKSKIVRQMPGRLVGETVDADGQRGFVLTLATREQHIKREKATSNICTNEALCALACTIHLCILGKRGIKDVASQNFHKAEYAKKMITALDGYELLFSSPTFNEFAIKTPLTAELINQKLLEQKIIGGIDLTPFYPEFGDAMLFCVTEQHTKAEIDAFARCLKMIEQESEVV